MYTDKEIMDKIHHLIVTEYSEFVFRGPTTKRGKMVLLLSLGDQEFEVTVKEKKEKCN